MIITLTREDVQGYLKREVFHPIVKAFKREFPFATYVFINKNRVIVGWHKDQEYIRYVYTVPDFLRQLLDEADLIPSGDYDFHAERAEYSGTKFYTIEDYE